MKKLGKQDPSAAPQGLGFQTAGREDAAVMEVGRAVLETMQEQAVVLADAQQALDSAQNEVWEALRTLEEERRNVFLLHDALATVGAFVRALEGADDPKPLLASPPENVQQALQTLIEVTPIDVAMPVSNEERLQTACPECVAGKHPNCTGEVLSTDTDGGDVLVTCACREAGHAL